MAEPVRLVYCRRHSLSDLQRRNGYQQRSWAGCARLADHIRLQHVHVSGFEMGWRNILRTYPSSDCFLRRFSHHYSGGLDLARGPASIGSQSRIARPRRRGFAGAARRFAGYPVEGSDRHFSRLSGPGVSRSARPHWVDDFTILELDSAAGSIEFGPARFRSGKSPLSPPVSFTSSSALAPPCVISIATWPFSIFPPPIGLGFPIPAPAALAAINAWRDRQGLSDVTAFQIWLQMAHRFGALLVAVGVVAFWVSVRKSDGRIPPLRRLSNVWAATLIVQITLGAWTIWSNKAADIATAHVAFGALLFAEAVAICGIIVRICSKEEEPVVLPALQPDHALTS